MSKRSEYFLLYLSNNFNCGSDCSQFIFESLLYNIIVGMFQNIFFVISRLFSKSVNVYGLNSVLLQCNRLFKIQLCKSFHRKIVNCWTCLCLLRKLIVRINKSTLWGLNKSFQLLALILKTDSQENKNVFCPSQEVRLVLVPLHLGFFPVARFHSIWLSA